MKKYLVYGDPIHITLLHTDLLFFIIPPQLRRDHWRRKVTQKLTAVAWSSNK